MFVAVTGALVLLAAPPDPTPARFSARDHYRAVYERSRETRSAATNAVLASWELARACFDLAEHAPDDAERERLGLEGADACQAALAVNPTSAPALYYLALNLGQVARTRLISALKLVRQMEAALIESARLDPHFDFAGADRALGLLYRDAPGWPTSVGSRSKARLHLERAVRLEPGYPGNQLALAETRLAWGEHAAVHAPLAALTNGWATNRASLSGPDWHTSWVEWQERRDALEAALRRREARSR